MESSTNRAVNSLFGCGTHLPRSSTRCWWGNALNELPEMLEAHKFHIYEFRVDLRAHANSDFIHSQVLWMCKAHRKMNSWFDCFLLKKQSENYSRDQTLLLSTRPVQTDCKSLARIKKVQEGFLYCSRVLVSSNWQVTELSLSLLDSPWSDCRRLFAFWVQAKSDCFPYSWCSRGLIIHINKACLFQAVAAYDAPSSDWARFWTIAPSKWGATGLCISSLSISDCCFSICGASKTHLIWFCLLLER